MKISKQKFGILSDGTKVHLYTVRNDSMSFSCTDYGCTLTSIVLNNEDGTKTDVRQGLEKQQQLQSLLLMQFLMQERTVSLVRKSVSLQ